MINIYITFKREWYDREGMCYHETRQLHYTVFDDRTAEAVIISVRDALGEADCEMTNAVKVFTPIKEVLER